MTALAKDTNVNSKRTERSISVKVAAGANIFAGAVVASNSSGFSVPASDSAGLVVQGIAERAADNTTGADGDLSLRLRKGTFELKTAGTVVDQADISRTVFVSDDATVEKAAGVVNNIPAGVLDSFDVETGRPWVTLFDETTP